MHVRETLAAVDVQLSYLRTTDHSMRPRLLLVHGSPNQATYWQRFLDDSCYQLETVAVDRPGFGESDSGHAIPGLHEQSQRIGALLVQREGFGTIVVGQSQGAPIACQMALDFPELVSGLILSAGTFDPRLNKARWYRRVAKYPPVSWCLPGSWSASNSEKVALEVELEQLATRLDEVRCAVHILHGRRDWVANPQNASWLAGLLTHADVEVELMANAGHKIPLTHESMLRNAIIEMARNLGIPEPAPESDSLSSLRESNVSS